MADDRLAKEYDIIIVGGGTAGCVLANRLSEDPDVEVLVLEAGEDRNSDERIYTPGLASELQGQPDYDWQYVTEPQVGLCGRVIKQPRGRVLGGSSAINSFALLYPSAAGFDAWADLGNKGWDWNGIRGYFRKFQTVSAPTDEPEPGPASTANGNGQGGQGPMQASYPLSTLPLHKAWLQAFHSLGFDKKTDPLDGMAIGGHISTNHISRDTQERSHAGIAYYAPVQGRANLFLLTGCTVRQIHFDGPARDGVEATATGVSFIKDGLIHQIQARKTVLLAAGAFATPQLLELSGIGDPSILKPHGIAIIHRNPYVGENLQDHIRSLMSIEAVDVGGQSPLSRTEARELYMKSRKGPWTAVACTFAYMPLIPFLSTVEEQDLAQMLDNHLDDPSLPEFERKKNAFIRQMVLSPSEATSTALQTRRRPEEDEQGRNWITFASMLSHPFSRGTVHIVSPDVTVKPKIDPQYYSNVLDLELHARHLKALLKLSQSPAYAQYYKAEGAILPSRSVEPDLEEAKCLLKKCSSTNYHPCGTCSMMPERMGGVVNDRLLVYGTSNVRVIDASMIPIIPRGNIITTVYAVAEKAADLISHDLGLHRIT